MGDGGGDECEEEAEGFAGVQRDFSFGHAILSEVARVGWVDRTILLRGLQRDLPEDILKRNGDDLGGRGHRQLG
jgi:hypothetical protein